MKFNEWITARTSCEELGSSDLGMLTSEDDELVNSQLSQLVDRVAGVMHNVSESKRSQMIEKFFSEVKARI